MWWSVVLAAVGVFGLYLTTRKMAAGYAVGVGVQVLWITYAVVTAQYGFIFSALAFGAVNALGFYKWQTEDNKVETKPTEQVELSSNLPTSYLSNQSRRCE